jgi:hypothetical protein
MKNIQVFKQLVMTLFKIDKIQILAKIQQFLILYNKSHIINFETIIFVEILLHSRLLSDKILS